ncbi:MAG: InlB B-repeat-containing protein, partial [Clostridia bacterium]|nr:InlB B-repeat-containing protein [Clostridia bacterium]
MTSYSYRSGKRLIAILMTVLLLFQSSPLNVLATALAENTAQEQEASKNAPGKWKLGANDDVRGETTWEVTFRPANDPTNPETFYVADGGTLGSQLPSASDGMCWRNNTGATITEDYVVTENMEVFEAEWNAEGFYTVNFRNRDFVVIHTYHVAHSHPLANFPPVIDQDGYNAYWAIGSQTGGQSGWEAGDRVQAPFEPNQDTDIIPDYEPIQYTARFLKEDESVLQDVEVDVTSSYYLNDIPAVPEKAGYTAKWVYGDPAADFNNRVNIKENAGTDKVLYIRPAYEQNIFTVTYTVDGEEYETDTYYTGDTLSLPADPVVEGKEFIGWFEGDTQHANGEPVTSDLDLVAKFDDELSVTFIVKAEDTGSGDDERLHQYFRRSGEAIEVLPQNPFIAGKVFEKWVREDTGEQVTAETVVEESFVAVAVFREITVYSITAEYYYIGNSGEVVFNRDLMQVEEKDLPYTITAPSTTQTHPDEVSGAPIYYPSTPTVEVELDDFDTDHNATVRIQYVAYTAEYDFVYKLKNLTGNGYTEIERTHVYGVLNSYVTPAVKTYDYAELEQVQGATINQASGQELDVLYTRKHFQLTYETNGGSYVAGVTVPYGTQQAVTAEVPTRTGYTFAGWYLDEGLTQRAGSTVQVNGDTTLYAKWTGNTVDYTIVYMFEKFNDAGTASSYVFDSSETGRGTVGATVVATDSSIPNKTKKGWEKDTARNSTSSVVITADGSAVLMVYYKLTTYTFTFTINSSSNNNRYRMTIKGTTYRGSDKYSFTAKLGQDVSADWPSNGGNATIWDNNNDYYFYYWNCQSTGYASKILRITEALLPNSGTNVSVTGTWRTTSGTIPVNYYLQNADDDGYTLSTLYSQTAPSGSYSPKEIAGYTYDHEENTTSGPWYNQTITAYNFYYNRHAYKIEYYHGTDKLKTISNVKYDATITGSTYNWTPTRAECGVDSDYIWGGWYNNAACEGTPYSFGKMPAGASNGSVALVLYAKWNAPTYTVTFVDGANTSTVYDSKTVEKYKKVSAPETSPTKSGYVFDGWYTTAGGETLYDWNNQITEDTTIYAHWTRATLSYTVHYVDEDGNPVADDKTVTNPNFVVGQRITEQAIAVAGFRPNVSSQELVLAESGNTLTFVYTHKAATTSYRVKYIIDPSETIGGGFQVHEDLVVENVQGDTASVIETAAAVNYSALYAEHPELDGIEFFPDEVEKTCVLSADPAQNVFAFYYSSFKNTAVTVHFVDMDGNQIADSDVQRLKVGRTFALSRTPIAGWELNKAVEGTAYNGTAALNSYKITDSFGNEREFTLFYQKKVTITANSFSKQYDGTALKMPADIDGQVTVEGLKEGHQLTSIGLAYADTDNDTHDGRVNAGVAKVTPQNAVFSGPVSGNYYKVSYLSGTLTVTQINVTIRVEPDRWTGVVYDGTEYKAGFTNPDKTTVDKYIMISHEGYKDAYLDDIWAAIQGKLHQGGAGLGYYAIAQTDAGDYTTNIGLTEADLPQNDNYSVSLFVRECRLQILPATLSVTTGLAGKDYDGTPLTAPGTATFGNHTESLTPGEESSVDLLGSDVVTITITGSQTDVGTSDNDYTIDWGSVNPDNYTVKSSYGKLTVREANLSIAVKDKTVPYSGQEQSGYTVDGAITGTGSAISTDDYTVTGLAEGDVLTVTGYTPATGTNAGTYTNGSFANAAITITRDGEDVSSNYNTPVTTANGTLTIEPKKVTITAKDASKTYDGTALTQPEFETSALADGDDHTFTVVMTADSTITNVGTQPNVIATVDGVAVETGVEKAIGGYLVTTVNGELEITKDTTAIVITSASNEWTYDGENHKDETYTVKYGD